MGENFGAYILNRSRVTQDTELCSPQAVFAKTNHLFYDLVALKANGL